MSDNDNFFNDDDLFGEFGDEPVGDDSGDFGDFGDDDFFADEDLLAFDEDDESIDFTEEDEFAETDEGPSRTFIIITALLILLLLGGFGVIAAILISNRGPSEQDLQRTSIAQTNDAVAIIIAASETQNAINMFQTQTVEAFTDTPTVTPTNTPTATNTPDTSGTGTAVVMATQQAANERATATAVEATRVFQLTLEGGSDLVQVDPITPDFDVTIPGVEATPDVGDPTGAPVDTGTEIAGSATETGDDGSISVDVGEVAQTATALAQSGQGGGGPTDVEPTPTREEGLPTVQPTVPLSAVQMTATALSGVFDGDPTQVDGDPAATATPRSIVGVPDDALPNTGLFDDVFAGSPLAIFAAALGLLGVIVISRGLRKRNRRD